MGRVWLTVHRAFACVGSCGADPAAQVPRMYGCADLELAHVQCEEAARVQV
jgi:hypothetical protein